MSELTDNPALMDLGEALAALDRVNPLRLAGRVSEVTGLVIRANVPGIRVGELVWIDSTPPCAPTPMLPGAAGTTAGRVQAEVVGFRGDDVVLLPLGEAAGIGPDSMVTPTGRPLSLKVGAGLLGRVLGGLGRPIAGGGAFTDGPGFVDWAVDRPSPDPLTRRRIQRPLALG